MKPEDTRWKVATREEVAKFAAVSFAGFQKMGQTWLREAEAPAFGLHWETNPNQWAGLAFFKKALEGGPTVLAASWGGNLGVPAQSLLEAVEAALHLRLVYSRGDSRQGNGSFTYSSDETMLAISFHEMGRYVEVSCVTINAECAQKCSALFERVIVPDNPEAGLVFSLASGMGGYSIRRLGAAGSPLERGNYNPKVLEGFDHIVQDLQTDSPCGRLVVMSGSPGTGKTFLVRSLLSMAKRAAFVVVPPQLVPELGSPEILPALTAAKSEFAGPIVLILEDADKVLVERNKGDMAAISAMLNLGDGILGAVLDIRILATTNAEKLEMDPATQRRGRLCRFIHVDLLEPTVANGVLSRLTQKTSGYQSPVSLADVYGQARDAGWVAPPIANPRPQSKPYVL